MNLMPTIIIIMFLDYSLFYFKETPYSFITPPAADVSFWNVHARADAYAYQE